MDTYDIVIVGAGAAGLLLADALGREPAFARRRILLLEKDKNLEKERTWCFWEKGEGRFDSLLTKSWTNLHFRGATHEIATGIAPYTYKMLGGADFFREYHSKIAGFTNISLRYTEVTGIADKGDAVEINTNTGSLSAKMVFNSLFSWQELLSATGFPVLQQHFVGWFVRTARPVFNPKAATFMDFSVAQKGNTRFMYVLPISETEALVEYTLFSRDLLEKREYEQAIEHYLVNTLDCKEYTIEDREAGRIPMTCHNFAASNTDRVYHIGTAGGWAKPSTGYTFMRTVRYTQLLAEQLKTGKKLRDYGRGSRFWWYDLLLLDILDRDNSRGSHIFESLFARTKTPLILKFLDEQTNLAEDMKVIWACPKMDFFHAMVRRLF